MDGMTHKAIAAESGVSPQTVNYRIGHALLRKELGNISPLMLFFTG